MYVLWRPFRKFVIIKIIPMESQVGVFSWMMYGAIHMFLIYIVSMTIHKCLKKEFLPKEFLIIVLLSSGCVSLLVTSGLICYGEFSGYAVSDIGFAAVPLCVLLMADGSWPLLKIVAGTVYVVSLAVFFIRVVPFLRFIAVNLRGMFMLLSIVAALSVVTDYIWRKVNEAGDWFGKVTAVDVIGGRINMVYLLLLLACQDIGNLAGDGSCWINRLILVLSLAFVLGLYSGICRRLMTGNLFLVLTKKESGFRDAMKVCIADMDRNIVKDDVCYSAIFERLAAYFDKEKPYLDGNLSIADVSRHLLTNKSYLSRTINRYTGRNFCQYVNYYRIRHSVEIFQADPGLKLADLAVKSGFHSIVSFSMAFRLYMNETPGEWCRKQRTMIRKK